MPCLTQLFTQYKGIVYVLIAASLWGLSGVCGQFLFQYKHISLEWLVVIRLIMAGSIMLGIDYYKQQQAIFQIWLIPPHAIRLIIFAIFGMLSIQLTFFKTIKYSNAATASVLQYLYPVIVVVIVCYQLKKPPSTPLIISVILAIAGAFLLATNGDIHSLAISPAALLWGIISAFAAAFYALYPHRLIQRYGAFSIVAWAMLIGGLFLSMFYPPWQLNVSIDITILLAIGFVIIFGTMIAFYLFLVGVEIIGGSKASVLNCAEPLSATLFSVLLLHVNLTLAEWIATACILLTVFILAKDSNN